MLTASLEKTEQNTNNFVVDEKRKLLKAWADIVILTELKKRARMSGLDVISSFKSKYGVQMSPGTIYPILKKMEKKKLIHLVPNRKKKVYVLTIIEEMP